jgi:hypothetical protein
MCLVRSFFLIIKLLLSLASKYNNVGIVQLLVNNGANINILDKCNGSALGQGIFLINF